MAVNLKKKPLKIKSPLIVRLKNCRNGYASGPKRRAEAENCARFYLCEVAALDVPVDLQSEMGLKLFPFGDWLNQYRQTRCRCFLRRP
jgi:hypothetical protein